MRAVCALWLKSCTAWGLRLVCWGKRKMGLEEHRKGQARIGFGVVTVSDTRRGEADTGGAYLQGAIEEAGHRVVFRDWVRDERVAIRKALQDALGRPEVQMVLFTGGTGLATRDVTVQALEPGFEILVPGFGELFRMLSFQEIGAASMLSRAMAGVVGGRLVVLLPGSVKALELAMGRILLPEAQHLLNQLGVDS